MGSDVNNQYKYKTTTYPYLVNNDRLKFPTMDFRNFRYSDNRWISGVRKTEPWQDAMDFKFSGYQDDGSAVSSGSLVLPGYKPSFYSRLFESEIVKGRNITIKIMAIDGVQTLVIRSGSYYITRLTAEDFRDGVIPDRLIVALQGAGGAGSGSTNYYFSGAAIQGNDGAGGGAGGFLAIVLNLSLLKQSADNYFEINLGECGKHGALDRSQLYLLPLVAGGLEGYIHGGSGGDGEDSYIKYNGRTIATVGGGKGSLIGGMNANQPAKAGKGGKVSLTNDPYTSQSETIFWQMKSSKGEYLCLTGADGGENGGNGNSTDAYTICAVTEGTYYKNFALSKTVGDFGGGAYGEYLDRSYASGGGASYFAAGGNGGKAASNGSDGKLGAGGGAGR